MFIGVPHNGELPYVWAYPLLEANPDVRDQCDIQIDIVDWNQEDIEYTRFIHTLWTNFAKYGYEYILKYRPNLEMTIFLNIKA